MNPRIGAALGLTATTVLGLAARYHANAVLAHEQLPLSHNDPFYHLRRVWLILHDFPHVPYVDRFCEYPLDARCHTWPGGFDFLLAVVARPVLGADPDITALARFTAHAPPLLGLLSALALYLLCRRAMGVAPALLATALFSLAPSTVMMGAYGRVDHHVLEPLLAFLFMWAYLGARRRSWRERGFWGWALLAGGAGGAAVASLPAGMAPLALATVVLALDLVYAALRGDRWPRVWAAGLAALGLTLVLGLGYFATTPCWGPPGSLDLSPFSLVLLAGSLLGLAALGLVVRWLQRREMLSAASLALALGLVAALGLALPLALPGSRETVARWLAFLSGSQLAGVTTEWWSLLSAPLARSLLNFTPLLLLWPLALAAMLGAAWRDRRQPELASLAHWGLAGAALGLVQAGYFRGLVAGALAPVMAWALCTAARAARQRWAGEQRRRRRLLTVATLVVACAALGWSWTEFNTTPAGDRSRQQAMEALGWIGQRSPRVDPAAGARQAPPYGVLASWNMGHWINVVAARPSASSPHLSPRLLQALRRPGCERGLCRWIRFALARDEAQALAEVRSTRSRYLVLGLMDPGKLSAYLKLTGAPTSRLVVQDESGAWRPGPGYWRLVHQRLYVLNGSAVGMGRRPLPGLRHFRLRHVSSRVRLRLGGRPLPWIKVFEFLPRVARVTGPAPAGSLVLARLQLRNARGHVESYTQVEQADARGRFTLYLPYAQRGQPPGERGSPTELELRPVGSYRLRSGTSCAGVSLTEAQVRSGAEVRVVWHSEGCQ